MSLMDFDFKSVLSTEGRILTFRASRAEFEELDVRHLVFGLFCTWLAGMGRSWDDPNADLVRHLGLGSLIYVCCLTLLLWLVVRPLSRPDYSYWEMLTFVCLTSPPALLYAIPVDQFLSLEAARNINLVFLAVVAAWRVALLVFYLRRGLGMKVGQVVVATLLPLSIVMSGLTVVRLTAVTFQAMGGLRSESTGPDPLKAVLDVLGAVAVYSFLPLLAAQVFLAQVHKQDLESGRRD